MYPHLDFTTPEDVVMRPSICSACTRLTLALAVLLSTAGLAQAQIRVVNMIPKSLSGEKHQDSEPNLAVNPADPLQMAATAFTPDPLGGPNAPIYVSANGGKSWALNSIVPSRAGSFTGTFDITLRFATSGKMLYAGMLKDPTGEFLVLRTKNYLSPTVMEVLKTTPNIDQPFIQVLTSGGRDHVYIGNNDFNAVPKTATITQTLDGGAPTPAFSTIRIEPRATSGQNGPSIRPAIHRDGTVYAVYFGWRSFSNPNIVTDVVVVRDDEWGASTNPYTALKDPNDHLSGVRVVTGRHIVWDKPMGQERTGSDLTIAVDPRDSSTVYVAWCDEGTSGNDPYNIHVRRSTDRGATWSPNDLLTIPNGKNPALAINHHGRIGLLYQQFINQRWETRLAAISHNRSRSAFGDAEKTA
jgi:hypothetical protein